MGTKPQPSPGPWRKVLSKPRRILDAENQMVCMVSGANADANADFIAEASVRETDKSDVTEFGALTRGHIRRMVAVCERLQRTKELAAENMVDSQISVSAFNQIHFILMEAQSEAVAILTDLRSENNA